MERTYGDECMEGGRTKLSDGYEKEWRCLLGNEEKWIKKKCYEVKWNESVDQRAA